MNVIRKTCALLMIVKRKKRALKIDVQFQGREDCASRCQECQSSELSQGPVLGHLPFSSSIQVPAVPVDVSAPLCKDFAVCASRLALSSPLSCRLTYSTAYLASSSLQHSFHKVILSTHHRPDTVPHHGFMQRT